ncbi:MAG: biopolymer transporter ExbD [Chromatiales bacterium]|jgi:biopolymer transport protein ExbD|nr:biopolymer transporter ExbD [Chromatiales bacterium]MDX9766041.1 biopolymer transporter ExbD [Ectothiorhodospiraceae bacterium]
MAFGGFGGSAQQPMAEINMIPLVDIMLVLLVIFIITAPVITHAVKVDLPRVSSERNPVQPNAVVVSVDAAGRIHVDDRPVAEAQLTTRLRELAAGDPATELHLHADKATAYEVLAQVMGAARTAGIQRIGFVTDPQRR